MQIQILYFARFREKLGRDSEAFELAADRDTSVQSVLDVLAARGGVWQELFDCEKGVLAAINQEMVSRETLVYDEDELALFPPVTGG
ncbi:MAG: molybdopterin converting factor subunit 1 [Pedobacter sp.]|nr:molybdopterin converting factor subunit 1 [Pedobacter sp.]